MVAIITGDIINSRNVDAEHWLIVLKHALSKIGSTPKHWEIYRGDSFQVEISVPDKAILHAIKLKAAIKAIKGLDIRLAIGIGRKKHNADKISESNGSAFIYSGEGFEQLDTLRQTLALFTSDSRFNERMNICLKLALIAMDSWTPAVAEFVKLSLEYPTASQTELGDILGIYQSSVSERQTRSYLTAILQMEALFRKEFHLLEDLK